MVRAAEGLHISHHSTAVQESGATTPRDYKERKGLDTKRRGQAGRRRMEIPHACWSEICTRTNKTPDTETVAAVAEIGRALFQSGRFGCSAFRRVWVGMCGSNSDGPRVHRCGNKPYLCRDCPFAYRPRLSAALPSTARENQSLMRLRRIVRHLSELLRYHADSAKQRGHP